MAAGVALAAMAALAGAAAGQPAPATTPVTPALTPDGPRVIIAFLPVQPALAEDLLDELEKRRLAIGLTSQSVGGYSPEQTVLHMSQGARLSARGYDRSLSGLDLELRGRSGRIDGWAEAKRRARTAPGRAVPGLLGQAVQDAGGDVAFAGAIGARELEAVAVADRSGAIDRVSLGTEDTVARRALDLLDRHQLVAARLPDGHASLEALDTIRAGTEPDELVYAIQAPGPEPELLATALAGHGFKGVLTSRTTRRSGLVATSDLAPTALRHLGLRPPSAVEGHRVQVEPGEQERGETAGELHRLSDRLAEIIPRREATLAWLLAGWAAVSLVLVIARRHDGARSALRLGLLGLLWAPGLALLTAALRPAEPVEIAVIVGGAIVLAAVTDRLVAWPVAPAVPAAVVIAAHATDLLAGSPLIATSVAGPNPIGGVRFYGVGNELETILSIAVLVGTGAALTRLAAGRPGWPPRAFAVACLVVAVIVGAGRLGAAVGGVVTLGAGGAAAVLYSLPRRPSRRALALAALVPVVAVAILAAIDLVTAGTSRFSEQVLDGGGLVDLPATVLSRLGLSIADLVAGDRAIAVGVAAIGLAAGFLRRRRLLAPLDRTDPVAARAFRAGLAGALTATIVGALANDSGPAIFMIGSGMLALAVAYVQGRPSGPAPIEPAEQRSTPPVPERSPEPEPLSSTISRCA